MGGRKCLSDAGDGCPADLPPSGVLVAPSQNMADYYARMEQEFDATKLTQRVYTKESESLQDWVKRLWYRYCKFRGKDPLDTLKLIPIGVLHNFFHWMLQVRSGTLRAASTLQTYWNAFCQVRKQETGCHVIDPLIKSQMHGVRQRLAQEFKLSTEKKAKPIMRAEDEFELLRTLWSSPELTLEHERLRVQLALILQLAGITGNRPGALLSLRYRNIKVALLRDPSGSEWPRLVIDLKFENTKGYLGMKDANTFPIPEVPREPCLLLCPHIILLSLMFADQAFAPPDLTSPETLFQLRVPSGSNQQELLIPIKDEMAGVPVFRRLESTVHGLVVSQTAAVSDNWLRESMARVGAVAGFDLPVGPYCFRRGNGEALDNSSLISDSQRNLILQHASSAVFQKNYLSRYITQDVQAIYRGLEPQTAVVRAASGMSRSIDQRRPRALNESQLAEVGRHPEVRLLLRVRKSLAKRIHEEYGPMSRLKGTEVYEAYQEAFRAHRSKKKAVQKALLADVKARWRKQQPLADIAHQLAGPNVLPDEDADSGLEKQMTLSAERTRAMSALFTFSTSDPAEECERRSKAINAISALSRHQEPKHREICRKDQTGEKQDVMRDDGHSKAAPPSFPLECPPTQCIFCLGNSELSLESRQKTFRNHDGLKRHFHRKHLRHYPDDQAIDCPHPECSVRLASKEHLQNHAAKVHNTLT